MHVWLKIKNHMSSPHTLKPLCIQVIFFVKSSNTCTFSMIKIQVTICIRKENIGTHWKYLRLWSESWGVSALEFRSGGRRGCPRAHLVVISIYLSFSFAWMYIWCKSMWFEFFECGEACLRGLEVFRLHNHLTWLFWAFKGLFESFGGV